MCSHQVRSHQVRAATKMVLKLHQADSPYVDPKIRELMAMVRPGATDKPKKSGNKRLLRKTPNNSSDDVSEVHSAKKKKVVTAHSPAVLDDDIVFCGFTCNCVD